MKSDEVILRKKSSTIFDDEERLVSNVRQYICRCCLKDKHIISAII